MSTPEERKYRTEHRILPYRAEVRQRDGTIKVQILDSDARRRKPRSRRKVDRDNS